MRLVHRVLGRREFGIKGIREFNKNSQMALSLDFKKNEYWRSGTSFGAGLLNWRGPELVTNGGFDSAANWSTDPNGWVISGGVAVASAIASTLAVYQNAVPAAGSYAVTFTVLNYSAGAVSVWGPGYSADIQRNANGTYTEIITTTGAGVISFKARGVTTLQIDNVSLKQVAATYTRSGDKYELDASGNPIHEAPNVPGIVPGVGYWSRAAVTNLLTYSQQFDNAAWSLDMSGTASALPVVTSNYTTAPDGTQTADRVQFVRDPTNGFSRIRQSTAAQAAGTYTDSVWMKALSGTPTLGLRATVDGSTSTYTTVTLGPNWQRVPFTATSTTTNTVLLEVLIWSSIAGSSTSADIALWQAQCVPGSDPGPIIVTTGSAATVGADVLNLASPITADQDFVFWTVVNSNQQGSASYAATLSDGTMNNVVGLLDRNTSENAAMRSGAGAFSTTTTGVVPNPGRIVTLMRRRSGKNTSAIKNTNGSVTVGTESGLVTFPASLNKLFVGTDGAGANQQNGIIEFVGLKLGTFSDADLTALLQGA